jgi:predicted Rossmann fold flavoprotein
MFPVTDDSATIVDCLERAARAAGVEVRLRTPVKALVRDGEGFVATLAEGPLRADRVILATGGGSGGGGHALAAGLGHAIEPPVPSLFTFHIAHRLLADLAGLSVEDAAVRVEGLRLRERGPVLVTHNGLSGPGILRLSAWGARELAGMGYRFTLRLSLVPTHNAAAVAAALADLRTREPRKQVTTWNPFGLPSRLWERLVEVAGIPAGTTWANLGAAQARSLAGWLTDAELPVAGKSAHKEEFVTCGGVRLREVDFKTLESKVAPGLHLAGEVLDIDGVTGGFNFQAAWTTGWLAGNAAAA